jgi:DNA modification methylase
MKVARELGRNSIGYEINPNYVDVIREKIGANDEKSDVTFEFVTS